MILCHLSHGKHTHTQTHEYKNECICDRHDISIDAFFFKLTIKIKMYARLLRYNQYIFKFCCVCEIILYLGITNQRTKELFMILLN